MKIMTEKNFSVLGRTELDFVKASFCFTWMKYKFCHVVFHPENYVTHILPSFKYEGRTESHEQLFFACELGTADEGEYGGRWNQLLCYP